MWGIERGYVQERQTENDSSQKEREREREKERMRERETYICRNRHIDTKTERETKKERA